MVEKFREKFREGLRKEIFVNCANMMCSNVLRNLPILNPEDVCEFCSFVGDMYNRVPETKEVGNNCIRAAMALHRDDLDEFEKDCSTARTLYEKLIKTQIQKLQLKQPQESPPIQLAV